MTEDLRQEALELRKKLGIINGDIILCAVLNELIKLNEKFSYMYEIKETITEDKK